MVQRVELSVSRQKQLASQIAALHRNKPGVFLIGAAHFGGPNSLQAQLKLLGMEIARTQFPER